MKKILFVCHGNICRSPMAEFVFKKIVKDAGMENKFIIESAAVFSDASGCDIHSGTKEILEKYGIPFSSRSARTITLEDYEKFDLLIGMDVANLFYMEKFWNKDPLNKVKLLLSYTGRDRDIADPWYTHNFEQTYKDVLQGSKALLEACKENSV